MDNPTGSFCSEENTPPDLLSAWTCIFGVARGARGGSFLERFGADDLAVSLPPALRVMRGGLGAINALLTTPGAAPGPADAREVVYGGLLAPGEPSPRAIPDRVSLRIRFLSQVPYATLTAGALLAHRRSAAPWRLLRHGGRVEIARGDEPLGDLLGVLDGYMKSRGWLVSRHPRRGLESAELVELMEGLGVVVGLSHEMALSEDFFARMQSEAEDRELYAGLGPVEDSLVRYLEELPPAVGGR